MGQGTSITQDAIRLLGEEGVHLAVTGTGGTPIHMGGLTNYTATRHFREMLPIYMEPDRSLLAAHAVMLDRTRRMKTIGTAGAKRYLRARETDSLTRICQTFDDRLQGCTNIQSLLGFEGAFSKACYAEFSRMSGVAKGTAFRRNAGADQPSGKSDSDPWRLINRLIDHGNYLCYGMAGAALWALGIPPNMSIFHGKTRAGGLVFDIADSFKDALVLPIAFSLASYPKGDDPEKVFRTTLISAFDDRKILSEAISTVDAMLATGKQVGPKGRADA